MLMTPLESALTTALSAGVKINFPTIRNSDCIGTFWPINQHFVLIAPKSLSNTSEPIPLSEIKQKMDLRGLMKYAKEKGVKVEDLSDEEKLTFIGNINTDRNN